MDPEGSARNSCNSWPLCARRADQRACFGYSCYSCCMHSIVKLAGENKMTFVIIISIVILIIITIVPPLYKKKWQSYSAPKVFRKTAMTLKKRCKNNGTVSADTTEAWTGVEGQATICVSGPQYIWHPKCILLTAGCHSCPNKQHQSTERRNAI